MNRCVTIVFLVITCLSTAAFLSILVVSIRSLTIFEGIESVDKSHHFFYVGCLKSLDVLDIDGWPEGPHWRVIWYNYNGGPQVRTLILLGGPYPNRWKKTYSLPLSIANMEVGKIRVAVDSRGNVLRVPPFPSELSQWSTPKTFWRIHVQYWFLESLCLILPAFLLLNVTRSRIRVWRRKTKGLCIHCGYDLRATKDHCPECGKSSARGK